MLLPALLGSEKARRHFEREVELAAGLNHPSIVAIRDSGIARGHYYFSMEYIQGEPLDRYVSSRSLGLRDKMVLLGRLCEAVAHAHQKGVIHRDLKPSNVLVDEHGQPHILDFGLAKSAGGYHITAPSAAPSMPGQVKGTPAYMSPEQAAGHTHLVDIRTDVYSLGVIMYQIVLGRFPYEVSGSDLHVLQTIQNCEPERPRRFRSRFDSDLEAILLKALAKDPKQRYQSVPELYHDVQNWLQDLPIVAKSVSSLYLLRKMVARHRRTSAIVALLMIILLGFSFGYLHVSWTLRALQVKYQEVMDSLVSAESDQKNLARQATFMHVLDLWHRGQVPPVQLRDTLSRQTREAAAQRFLFDPAPLADSVGRFQQEIKGEPFFAEFVVAERYLKDGNRQKALEYYRRCYARYADSPADQLIKMRVGIRLYDLSKEPVRTNLP